MNSQHPAPTRRPLPGEPDCPEFDEHEPEAWEALPGHLDDVHELLTRHVAFPNPETADAVVAWVVHAHLVRLNCFESTPRLALLSPEKGSGKTRTLEILELLCPQPVNAVNVSAAVLFRLMEDARPTLLLDECDTYLGPRVAKDHEDIRALVNAGHRRRAQAYRCVGEGGKMTAKSFAAFGAVALAGLGDLPDTILQRSIVISMKRRAPGEVILPYRRTVDPVGHAIRDRISRWATEWAATLDLERPLMPDGITDRPADVWEPLIVIGDAAGRDWSDRIRQACVSLNAVGRERDPSLGVRLLVDIRTAFGTEDRLHTETLLERLNANDDVPWGNLRGQPLDGRALARLLRPYEIRRSSVRIGEFVRKGYLASDFADAWTRYLPERAAPSPEWVTEVTEVTENHADVTQ